MTALEFVQGAPSIHLVVAEINDSNRFEAEDLAAAYAIDILAIEKTECSDENIQKKLDELLFYQAKFDEKKAMAICLKIVNS